MVLFGAGFTFAWVSISVVSSDWWSTGVFGVMTAVFLWTEHWDRRNHPTKWRQR
jgi:hypothetical protein